jgi:hypothetical protein
MPFPYVFHENFENGTKGGFTSETDVLGKLDFPDHNEDLDIQPWRGGYVMRVNMDRGTDEAYVQHDTALDIPNGQNRYIRFYLRFSDDTRVPDFDGSSFKIFRVYTGVTEEFAIGITCSESEVYGPRLAIWSPDDTEFIDGLAFQRNVWLPIQIIVKNAASSGRVYVQLEDNVIQVARMTFGTFTHCQLGVMAQSPKVRGTVYFDDIIIDTAKLEEPLHLTQDQLWGNSQLYTKSSYAFVGPGTLRGATLIGGGSDNLVYFYDVDRLPLAHHDIKVALRTSSAESKDTLIDTVMFKRGCYIAMTGTNPQVIVHYGDGGIDNNEAA